MHSQHEQAVLSICPGPNKKWHVKDSAARSALASFNNVQDACAWAIEVAQNRQARVVVERTESSAKGGADWRHDGLCDPRRVECDRDGAYRAAAKLTRQCARQPFAAAASTAVVAAPSHSRYRCTVPGMAVGGMS
jgi:hypothetical protein